MIHLIVPESKNTESELSNFVVPHAILVCRLVLIVLATVQFNNQPVLEAREVNDVPRAWRLSAEMKSLLALKSEVDPELYLLRCHGFA
jgi:hypothetical protein